MSYPLPGHDWESEIDNAIREAIGNGKTTHLPGAGKPLDLKENPHSPQESRLANKLLADHGFLPDWMMLGQEIEARLDAWHSHLNRAYRGYRGALGDALRIGDPVKAAERVRSIEAAWVTAKDTLEADAERINSAVLTYNLKVPQGVSHRPLLIFERALADISS